MKYYLHLLLFEFILFWYLTYAHNLIFATQVLTKLVRPLYMIAPIYGSIYSNFDWL